MSLIMLTIVYIPFPLNEKIPLILSLLLIVTFYQSILLDKLPATETQT